MDVLEFRSLTCWRECLEYGMLPESAGFAMQDLRQNFSNTPVMATCGDQLFEVWWTWIDTRSTLLPGCKLWPERHSEPMITARWLGRRRARLSFGKILFVETGERVDQDITSSLASLSIRVQNTSSRPSHSISLQSEADHQGALEDESSFVHFGDWNLVAKRPSSPD